MYKVVVEYARLKGNGTYEDMWQELDKLVIYQDGKPYGTAGMIWKYGATNWPTGLNVLHEPTIRPAVPPGPEIAGDRATHWAHPVPWQTDRTTWGKWEESCNMAIDAHTTASNKPLQGAFTALKKSEYKHVIMTIVFVWNNKDLSRVGVYKVGENASQSVQDTDLWQSTIYFYTHYWSGPSGYPFKSDGDYIVLDGTTGGYFDVTNSKPSDRIHSQWDWNFSISVNYSFQDSFSGDWVKQMDKNEGINYIASIKTQWLNWEWGTPFLQFGNYLPVQSYQLIGSSEHTLRKPFDDGTTEEMLPQDQE